MERDEGISYSRKSAAKDFLVLAGEYRRVSTCLIGMGRYCKETGIECDKVLDIVFTHIVSYIEKGASQMELAASRLARSEGEAAPMVSCGGANPAAEQFDSAVRSPIEASEMLRNAALSLQRAMNRALDLVEKVGDDELVGDPHSFGHVIQGICMPYILLASDMLEKQGSEMPKTANELA